MSPEATLGYVEYKFLMQKSRRPCNFQALTDVLNKYGLVQIVA